MSREEPGSSRQLTRAERVEALKEAARERMRAHRKRWTEESANAKACDRTPRLRGHGAEVHTRAECDRESPATLQNREVTKEPGAAEARNAVEAKPKRGPARRRRAGDETNDGRDQQIHANGRETPHLLHSGTGDMLHQWLLKSIEVMDEDSRSTDSPGQSQPGTPLQTSHSPGAVNMGLVAGDAARHPQTSKYTQLLAVIEELGRDIRPTYAGSKSSAERLKRGIVHARILVRECLMETERNARS
ncbi:uncharacterized protein LOC142590105 [Dermacentor variabilis]|uniref:uncharacterized protein LOC142590105 n=1 Tax=Dermacentor variabilis TaxID=34621 RepID=UPI003F5C7F1D